MAKFVCVLVCLAVVVCTGYASLSCYRCSSEKEDGCTKHAKLETQVCGNPATGTKSVCYYKYSLDKDKKISVNSSCALIPQNSPMTSISLPECAALPGGEVKECRLCDSNLCNSAPAFGSSYALLSLPIMYMLAKVFAH